MDLFQNKLDSCGNFYLSEPDLKYLDGLIKENVDIRSNTPELFYDVVLRQFKMRLGDFGDSFDGNLSSATSWNELNLTMNCLKNSAAAQKSQLNPREDCLIKYLISYLKPVCLNWNKDDSNIKSFNVNLLKYISNLLQGI